MIAASEPQEFVPSGRQQALRHPTGPHEAPKSNCALGDDILLEKLEKVSLKEKKDGEWWVLRKLPVLSPATPKQSVDTDFNAKESFVQYSFDKSQVRNDSEDSFGLNKSADLFKSKRISGISKSSHRRSSGGVLLKPNCGPFSVRHEVEYTEDELYVRGNVVIWSRGLSSNCDNLDNSRTIVCSYTFPQLIKHALWCTFYRGHPTYESELTSQYKKHESPPATQIPAICVADNHNIRVFTLKGEDFVTALPFKIVNVWSTNFGIVIEKKSDSLESDSVYPDSKTSLYSLDYPLDEVSPVVINNGGNLQTFCSNDKIVFTSEDPSICMVYNYQSKQHGVYYVRKISENEKTDYFNKLNNTTYASTPSMSNKLKNRLSMWDILKNTQHLSVPSPISSRPGSAVSFHLSRPRQSRSHSSLATFSRCQSPANSSAGNSWFLRESYKGNNSIQYSGNVCMQLGNNYSYFDASYLHTTPSICFEHLWTEPYSTMDDNMLALASKVFLSDDFTGQWYLCYILPASLQLVMVQVDFSNINRISFGMVNNIGMKDALPIPNCHMVAILEHSGNVTLYSGLTPVGKLHLGGTLVQHTPSPYVRRHFSKFNSPFPRRSSLLPHSTPVDPKFDEHLLSPVLPETPDVPSRPGNVLHLNFQMEGNLPKALLNGLRDPIENRITLRYSDGTYYRITLPPLTSHPLIESCIITLKQCLSKDTILVILTKWYATRNALGNQDASMEEEWFLFQYLLFELLGYEEKNSETVDDVPVTPSSNPKRQKHSSCGTDEDWSTMMNSNHHKQLSEYMQHQFGLKINHAPQNPKSGRKINTNSVLFPHFRVVHYSFHLLYEDLKLNLLRGDELKLLAKFLSQLSGDLGLAEYCLHYWKDFPETCEMVNGFLGLSELRNVLAWPFVDDTPANIMKFIHDLIMGRLNTNYPFIKHVNDRSRDVIQICGAILKEVYPDINPGNLVNVVQVGCGNSSVIPDSCGTTEGTAAEQALFLIADKNFDVKELDTLPPAIYLLFYGALWKCRRNPPPDLPVDAYYLLWRDDLAAQALKIQREKSEEACSNKEIYNAQLQGNVPSSKQIDVEQQDGMEDMESPIMKLRFPDDVRVAEARKMLQSSKPIPIVLVQRPDVSDHDFIEEQEKHLYAVCTRTMALSPGRGMMTLRTSSPVITEPLQTPQLCLTGKAPPRGTTVELSHIDTPSNMNLWPLFHNGVANGLRISPEAHNIDNTWIIFNKPKSSVEQQMEHAGFLMALGLNGHLKNLDVLNTYDYLIKFHEMTSIGILLGLSATFRGTANSAFTKTLSIHVEALLPPTSMELDVHQNVQVAALLGIGLVYQGTCHRHIIEVLLSEIGRPPGPEMENSIDRESYSLAAGLALGLVTLKQGSCFMGLSDLNVPDTLKHYMVGGNKRPLTGAQKDKYKVPSFQIREGSSVNLDVTAPGATIALGLMYLGSGNKAVADWMSPPETQYLLDFVRPDFLMFRILARALILWDDIKPTKEWIENQVPSTIRPYCMIKPQPNSDVDYEAMNQAYCNIVTGACFALGLKYAGSADEEAFRTLLHFCHMFTNITIKSIAELAGKPTVETCLNVLLLSTSMVMAGTGNLDVMRLVRLLRRRVGVTSSAVVTYGSHLALHMSLGLLFLGGGRYTLSNSPGNIAALICAFYPKFPTHSNDNRYHLQAFRHLYVLAVEPRLIIPKDVHSKKSCYANLQVVKIDGTTSFIKGPGIIPDLNVLHKVAVDDERYWPVIFERGRNWDLLIKIISTDGFIEVKQRAGCLSYIVDKLGYHSQLARTLTQCEIPWDPPASSIISFTHDQGIKYFCDHFLTLEGKQCSTNEMKFKQMLTKITYEAVVKDKLIVVPVFTYLAKVLSDMKNSSNLINFWQVKLIVSQVAALNLSCDLLSTEVVVALEQQVIEVLESWERGLISALRTFLSGGELNFDKDVLKKLAMYVTYYNLPYKCCCSGGFVETLVQLQNFHSTKTVDKVIKLMSV